jgi:hypothetical protein
MPSIAETVAKAIVESAIELVRSQADGALHQKLLAAETVSQAWEGFAPTVPRLTLLICASIAAARSAFPIWESAHPEIGGPLQALQAAEAWAACPCPEDAKYASEHMALARDAFAAQWAKTPKEPAWAARAVAWAADAPKYHWQAVTALYGACHASSSQSVTAAVARCLERFLESERQ